jgi:DNA-binding NtrC family response regulator
VDRPGLFTHAEGGTVFLDEIGEMTPIMQVKFLRVLQEREVCPIGGRAPHPIDIRLICATNRDLARQVREGHFREDLYYRVNVIRIDLPPLRERAADIPELCRHFLRTSGKTLSPRAKERLLRYPWPGNVRELANVLSRAEVLAPGPVIQPEDFDLPGHPVQLPCPLEPLGHFLDRAERTYLLEVLRSSRWSRRKSAAILGIDRSTLYRLMKKYRLEPEVAGTPGGLDLPEGLSPLDLPGSGDADPRYQGRMAAS